jgi:hypothetical protein
MEDDIERAARDFISENEPLLQERSSSAVQRIHLQATRIATALTDECAEAGRRTAEATRALTEGIGNPATPPQRLDELEKEKDKLKEVFERKSQAVRTFDRFLERAKLAYRQRSGEAEQEE